VINRAVHQAGEIPFSLEPGPFFRLRYGSSCWRGWIWCSTLDMRTGMGRGRRRWWCSKPRAFLVNRTVDPSASVAIVNVDKATIAVVSLVGGMCSWGKLLTIHTVVPLMKGRTIFGYGSVLGALCRTILSRSRCGGIGRVVRRGTLNRHIK
jgi:hypothetical protein